MRGLTISFVGDIYAKAQTVQECADAPEILETGFRALRGADVRFANLEAPLVDGGTPQFSTGVRLSSPPDTARFLTQLGIDVVSIANNHQYDFGEAGVRSTLAHLRSAGVKFAGAGANRRQAEAAAILEVNGQRIGILAACDDEGGGATSWRAGVNTLAPGRLVGAVRALREAGAFPIVSVHTGIEFAAVPEPFFRKLARRLIECGAVVVVGHHPHVPQGVERYGSGLIAYSLGDFLFDLPRAADDMGERARFLNRLHMILDVNMEDEGVRDYRCRFLRRNPAGRFEIVEEREATHEFASLCRLLGDSAMLDAYARNAYRGSFRETVYDTPIHFWRSLRDGSASLRSFLWWLATLRRQPKRRMLRHGLRAWCQHLGEHLSERPRG